MKHTDIIRKRYSLPNGAAVRVKSLGTMTGSDSHTFSATISAATVDRDGELLLPAGMSAREASGTVFWNHDYDRPIGLSLSITPSGDRVRARGRFLKRPAGFIGTFFPDFARAFVTQAREAGRGVGVSVGLLNRKTRRPTKSEKDMHGPGLKSVVTAWDLLEWSIAPVQTNTSAVTDIKSLDRYGIERVIRRLPRQAVLMQFNPPARTRALKGIAEDELRRIVRDIIAEVKI